MSKEMCFYVSGVFVGMIIGASLAFWLPTIPIIANNL